jgi:hypothetical protein
MWWKTGLSGSSGVVGGYEVRLLSLHDSVFVIVHPNRLLIIWSLFDCNPLVFCFLVLKCVETCYQFSSSSLPSSCRVVAQALVQSSSHIIAKYACCDEKSSSVEFICDDNVFSSIFWLFPVVERGNHSVSYIFRK